MIEEQPSEPSVHTSSLPAAPVAGEPADAPPARTLSASAPKPAATARNPDSAHQPTAIHQAIDEVMEVIETLKHAVDQMEEVLELMELAERQKLGDEREIDALRRSLRQLHDRAREHSHGAAEGTHHSREAHHRESRGGRDSHKSHKSSKAPGRPPRPAAPAPAAAPLVAPPEPDEAAAAAGE